ncbi:MAG: MoaD/ThiS family protein [Desulfobacteraceae bacterium]|jgi:sulfur carrier protein ThiS
MKVTVKLYGTLQKLHPGYRHAEGIEADVPDGTTIAELFSLLNLPLDRHVSVIMDGRARKAEAIVFDGACLNVFQPMHGG